MSKLFGLEVKKKEKGMVVLFSMLAVICIVLYFVLALYEPAEVVVVNAPSGGLTESIFDSQNLVYKKEEGFNKRHAFSHVPYSIDTVSGQRATVGSGVVYRSEPYYFYYSEMKTDEDLAEVLKKELTSIISIYAEPASTELDVLKEEEGYVNGCRSKYYCLRVTVNNADSKDVRYICLYRLHFDESVYQTDWDMLVGCMSHTYSTDALANLQVLSYSSIGTLKYDKSLEKR